ncbi:hypothetical protein MMC12_005113 [Toensbergia leucococca]|nr:hypothetical protein [Toensbergia leucococca]
MLFHGLYLVFAIFLSTVLSQTIPGFLPSSSETLTVTFANNIEPELTASRKDSPQATYMVFMIDIDAVYDKAATTFLQWYQPDLSIDYSSYEFTNSNETNNGAVYISPMPLPSSTHRYILVLFAEPPGYKLPSCYQAILSVSPLPRFGFDILEFIQVAGLGSPVATNYLKVSNSEPATTTQVITTTSLSSASCAKTKRAMLRS